MEISEITYHFESIEIGRFLFTSEFDGGEGAFAETSTFVFGVLDKFEFTESACRPLVRDDLGGHKEGLCEKEKN